MNARYMLAVEDDHDDAALIAGVLEARGPGTRLEVRPDGPAALEFLRSPEAAAEPPALILLDLMLPKMHGLEVLREIRRLPRLALAPVVVFSSSKQAEDRRRAYDLGASGYAAKPTDFNEFEAALRDIFAYWIGRNLGPY